MTPDEDLYAVLGVAPDADERAVKVAYFTLVRAYPPETHPEQFQRIRAAYEVLSDPARRAQHDEERARPPERRDPEADALWNAARDARNAGDADAELRALRRLCAVRPELADARRALFAALANAGRADEALALLPGLLTGSESDVALHLQASHALQAAGRLEQARTHAQQALARAPRDPQALVAVADRLAALGERAQARTLVDDAARVDGSPLPIPPLVRRLASYDVEDGDVEGAVARVGRALEAWAASGRDDSRDALAFLAGFAAFLFGRKEPGAANRLLDRAAALDPGASPGALPQSVALHAGDLPPDAREWLAAQRTAPRWHSRYYTSRWQTSALGALFVAIIAGGAFAGMLGSRDEWDPDGWAWATGLQLLLLSGVVYLASHAWRVRRSRFGHGLVVHSLHLVEVAHDRVRLLPLPRVDAVTVKGRNSGNVYWYDVVFRAGWRRSKIVVNQADDAQGLARLVDAQRERALELLGEGALHREDLWDLFPPAVVNRGGLLRSVGILRPRRAAAFVGGTLAAALALGAGAGAVVSRRVDAGAWQAAERAGTFAALDDYLVRPGAVHRREAERARARLVDRARAARTRLAAKGANPGLLLACEAAATGRGRLELVVGLRLDAWGAAAASPPPPTPAAWLEPARRAVTAALAGACGDDRVIAVVPAGPRPGLPRLEIEAVVAPAGDRYEAPGSRQEVAALDATWRVSARDAWGLHPVADGIARSPEELRVPEGAWKAPGASAAAFLRDQVRAELDAALARGVAAGLGLAKERSP